MTRYLLHAMQNISIVQSDIASMPSLLGELDNDLRSVGTSPSNREPILTARIYRTRTDNFKHLARLEGLIPAYVATVLEVVRRREYGQSFSPSH